jgi:hypothetical protein
MTCGDKVIHVPDFSILCQLFSPCVIVFLVKYIGFLQIKFEFRIQDTGLYLIIGPELSFPVFLLFNLGPPDKDQGCILNYVTFS